MTEPFVVTTVCTGNICRSPMAEAFLTAHLGELGVDHVMVRSAGTHASHGGPAMRSAVAAVNAIRGDLSTHRSTPLMEPLVLTSDLILCATREHRDHILEEWPSADPGKVRLFNEVIEDEAPVDVEDPYGWDQDVYDLAARVIDAAMEAWARRLASGWRPEGQTERPREDAPRT